MPLAPVPLARRATTTFAAAALLAWLASVGCPRTPADVENKGVQAAKAAPTVRLLVVDDEPLAAAIEREWRASGRGDLAISRASSAEWAKAKRLAADVVIYPAVMLGDLAEHRLIAKFPATAWQDEALAQADIFPLLRRRECTWGEKVYAVPFGSPQFVLLYRKDLLAKLQLAAPTTWSEYHEACRKLADAGGAENGNRAATAEPVAHGWGAKLLLARAAGYARHPNQYSALFDYQTMTPQIAAPPFQRALEELVAAHRASPQSAPLTPASCEQALLEGRCAMAITWPTRNAAFAEKIASDVRLGCTELPGAEQIYNFQTQTWTDAKDVSRVPLLGISGRLGSITTSARHTRAAAETLLWLAGKEKGAIVAAQSRACTLYRSSQVPRAARFISDQYDSTFAGQYGAALETANERPLSLEVPRIAGHDAFLAALDTAVQQALAGEKSPAEALAAAADAWRKIIAQQGVDQQRSAYLRSLGLEP